MVKRMMVAAIFVGVAVVGSVAWADGWWSSLFGGSKAEKPVAAAPMSPTAMANLGDALAIQDTDRVMGSMMAPVTLIEYASMTCSHCADFTTKTMPQVKKDWIDTGKVKYVLRDLAWDNLAVGMAKVARCAPADQYYPIAEALFASQANIVTSNDPLSRIKDVASGFGMSGEQVEACVKDSALHDQVEASKKVAMEGLGIRGTPTVFVNGERIDGAADYDTLKKTLEAKYAEATQGN